MSHHTNDVSAALNWTANLPLGKFIFVQDSAAVDGGFLVHHLIDLFLDKSKSVCLITLGNIYEHYLSVSKKLV